MTTSSDVSFQMEGRKPCFIDRPNEVIHAINTR